MCVVDTRKMSAAASRDYRDLLTRSAYSYVRRRATLARLSIHSRFQSIHRKSTLTFNWGAVSRTASAVTGRHSPIISRMSQGSAELWYLFYLDTECLPHEFHCLRISSVLPQKGQATPHATAAIHTLLSSSLILTHGRLPTALSLMTIFRALLFSFPPLESELKSFVSEVPIPKLAAARNQLLFIAQGRQMLTKEAELP